MPESDLPLGCYEDLLAPQAANFDGPNCQIQQQAYVISATETKGALYSHRSTVLHAYSVVVGVGAMLSEGARVLPVVPLFRMHGGFPIRADGWWSYSGGALDGASLFKLWMRKRYRPHGAFHGLAGVGGRNRQSGA